MYERIGRAAPYISTSSSNVKSNGRTHSFLEDVEEHFICQPVGWVPVTPSSLLRAREAWKGGWCREQPIEGVTAHKLNVHRVQHSFSLWVKEECWKALQRMDRKTNSYSYGNRERIHTRSNFLLSGWLTWRWWWTSDAFWRVGTYFPGTNWCNASLTGPVV